MKANTEGINAVKQKNILDNEINPATEETLESLVSLSGSGANGQTVCTLADTWYAIPSGTAPTSSYEIWFIAETVAGNLRLGFSNSGTPGTTNGVIWDGKMIAVTLGPSDVIYVSSDNAGDTINWTTKLVV